MSEPNTLPSAADLYGQSMQQLQGYGNAQQADLYQNYQNAMGMGMQSLASSGLAGTSIAPSMKMGYMKQYQLALNSLNEKLTQAKQGAQSTFGLGGIQSQQADKSLANQAASQAGSLNLGYAQLARQQNNDAFAQQAQQQNAGQQQDTAYNWQPSGYAGAMMAPAATSQFGYY